MEAKFTKGPWVADASQARTAINGRNGKHIAMVNCFRSADKLRDIAQDEHEANAQLIAASPLLYEALEAVEWISSHGFTFCPCCNHTKQAGHALDCALNNALRAARGEE